MSRRIISRNFNTENQSGFQIMHMFIFVIIFNKIRGFESQNHMNVVTNRFKTFLKQKTARLSILSFVFYCFANLLCISLFLQLMYFIVFLYTNPENFHSLSQR